MTAQRVGSAKPVWPIVVGLVAAAGVVVLGALAVGAFLALRATSGRETLTARISSLQAGRQAEINQPLMISAVAVDKAGVSRVEVYADGALILAQDSSGQVGPQLSLMDSWVPLTAGKHVLMSRAYGSKSQHADSELMYVDVAKAPESITIDVDTLLKGGQGPNPSLDVIAERLGTTSEDLVARNPSLAGISTSDPLPRGTHIIARNPAPAAPLTGSVVLPRMGAPDPPTNLAAVADCASAVLTWTASANAQTYRVYRVDPVAPRSIAVAERLRSTAYQDTGLQAPGTYRYQIASVRNEQESLSPMIEVSTPEDCAAPWGAAAEEGPTPYVGAAPAGGEGITPVPSPAAPGSSSGGGVQPPAPLQPGGGAPSGAVTGTVATDLVLTLASMDTDVAWEGVYCYVSINGSTPDRFPAGDFHAVPPETSDGRHYDLTNEPGGGRINLTGQPYSNPVTIAANCHGVRRAWSSTLSSFSVSHPQTEWDGTLRHTDSDEFRIYYCLGPASAPCGTRTALVNAAGLGPTRSFYFPPPTDLGWRGGTDAFGGVDCSDFSGLDYESCIALGTLVGRQMLFWNWTGNAIYTESSLTGYTVVRTVHDAATNDTLDTSRWYVNRRANGVLPKYFFTQGGDLGCGMSVEYAVQAIQGDQSSPLSDPIFIDMGVCPAAADVTITFGALTIGPAEDTGEEHFIITPARDDQLEVWGDLYAWGGEMRPTQVNLSSDPPPGVSLGAGTHQWANMDTYVFLPIFEAGHGGGHNIFRTRINTGGQTITFGTQLWEGDSDWTGYFGVTRNEWCMTSATVGPFTVQDWGRWTHDYTLTGGSAEGDCTITVHVEGAPVH